MASHCDSPNPIDELAEQFIAERRAGRPVEIQDYVQRHPEFAEQIQEVFSTLLLLEGIKPELPPLPPQAEPTEELPQLSDYRIFREIARGGMGIVYEAEQISLGRRVALKVLPSTRRNDPTSQKRFTNEAKSAAGLHHTNIVPVFEVGHENGIHFYAMQYIEGQGLDQVADEVGEFLRNPSHYSETCSGSVARQLAHSMIVGRESIDLRHSDNRTTANHGNQRPSMDADLEFTVTDQARNSELRGSKSDITPPTTPKDETSGETVVRNRFNDSTVVSSNKFRKYYRSVARIGSQAAEAIAYAHNKRVIHRDIKPANLLLDVNGNVWVADFGLAKFTDDGLTKTGDVVGTIRYIAPERFEGKCDTRSDVYSLGMTLYELLALRPAFETTGQLSLLEMIRSREPKQLREINPRIPNDLQTIIAKSIHKEPIRRYQTAKALADDLNRFIEGLPIRARHVSKLERSLIWAKRNPIVSSLLAMLAIGILATVVVSIQAAVAFKSIASVAEQASYENERSLYFAEMNLAGQASQSPAGIAHVRELVAKWKPKNNRVDFRDWEWFWLNSLQNQQESLDLSDFQPWYTISDCDWSPDGQHVVSMCGKNILFFDWDSKQLVKKLEGHSDAIFGFQFSHSGKLLATSSRDKTVRIWNWDSGEVIHELQHEEAMGAICWSPDDRLLVYHSIPSHHQPQELNVFDVASGKGLHRFTEDIGMHPKNLAFSPDGNFLATPGVAPFTINLWDTTTWKIVQNKKTNSYQISSIAWHPTGRWLATASRDKTVRVWDQETDQVFTVLDANQDMSVVKWSPDGKHLACSGWDGGITIWNLHDRQVTRTIMGHTGRVEALAWHPDGNRLVSGGEENTLRVVDVFQSEPKSVVKNFSQPTQGHHVTWNNTGNLLAVSNRVFDIENRLATPFLPHEMDYDSCVWNATGQLACLSRDGELSIWDAQSKSMVAHQKFEPESTIESWCPCDSRILVSKNYPNAANKPNSKIYSWDYRSKAKPITVVDTDYLVCDADWSADGTQVAFGTGMGQILVYHSRNGSLITQFKAQEQLLTSVAWSNDGSMLAVGGASSTVQIWDTNNWKLLRNCRGHHSVINAIAWSPDDLRIASGGVDRSLRIWDVETSYTALVLNIENEIQSLAWSPDGIRLAAQDNQGYLTVWDSSHGR